MKYYYILLSNMYNPLVIDEKLPIFWNKKIAHQEAKKFNARVLRIKESDIRTAINTGVEVKTSK